MPESRVTTWRTAAAACAMSTLLVACGGGGGGGVAPEVPTPTAASGPHEFDRCQDVPSALSVVREQVEGRWQTQRYVARGGEPLALMVAAAPLETAKNPEGVLSHGPLLAQNCTPAGTGRVQTLSLRVRTEGFFEGAAGDHLAFGLRTFYPTANRAGEEAYDAIGVIFHRWWGGVMGERFRRPGGNAIGPVEGPQVALRDGVDYLLEMEAQAQQVRWRVTVTGSGESTGWRSYQAPADFAPASGTGFLIAVLCNDDNARCEGFDRSFRVDVREMVFGWL